jgi:hypothetical protein
MAIKVANNKSLTAITALPSAVSGGAMTLLETQTASSSATISFTSNIDSTYDEYVFKFIGIHPQTDGAYWDVNFRDGGSSYDATKTTTSFRTYHDEGDSDTTLGYYAAGDVAQGTGVQRIAGAGIGADNDQSISGEMFLYSPSSTTYVKHFMIDSNAAADSNYSTRTLVAGYCNVTAAIDGVQFSMSTGNIDAGTIKLYGIKDS